MYREDRQTNSLSKARATTQSTPSLTSTQQARPIPSEGAEQNHPQLHPFSSSSKQVACLSAPGYPSSTEQSPSESCSLPDDHEVALYAAGCLTHSRRNQHLHPREAARRQCHWRPQGDPQMASGLTVVPRQVRIKPACFTGDGPSVASRLPRLPGRVAVAEPLNCMHQSRSQLTDRARWASSHSWSPVVSLSPTRTSAAREMH